MARDRQRRPRARLLENVGVVPRKSAAVAVEKDRELWQPVGKHAAETGSGRCESEHSASMQRSSDRLATSHCRKWRSSRCRLPPFFSSHCADAVLRRVMPGAAQ
eukprot:6176107-Pleurochrysis_carterae.AAC.8